jgi:enoyl-CoA hydratase/carnithine racemase
MDIGLGDLLATSTSIRDEAIGLAAEVAEAAPLAVESTRETLRAGLADAVEQQVRREFAEQLRLAQTADHLEGIRRRPGDFTRS